MPTAGKVHRAVPVSVPVQKAVQVLQHPQPNKPVEKKLSNPLYIGPGAWFLIHTSAKNVSKGDFRRKKEFMDLMNNLRNEFKCMECRKHMGDYIDTHPYDPYYEIIDPVSKKDIGLFKWSVDFHNAVNKRLGYPVLDWPTAYALWYDENDICDMDCGH